MDLVPSYGCYARLAAAAGLVVFMLNGLLGLGAAGVRSVPVNDRFQIELQALREDLTEHLIVLDHEHASHRERCPSRLRHAAGGPTGQNVAGSSGIVGSL